MSLLAKVLAAYAARCLWTCLLLQGLLCRVRPFLGTFNNHLRTGADKGNPTV